MAVSGRRRVHTVLVAALAVSVACNVAAAEPTIIGRSVAAWPPVALMLVVDVLGRVPTGLGWLGRVQVAGAGGVATVAAVASFTHMRHVAMDAGESELVAWLFPLTVDGLAVVCSVALVQINRRRHLPAVVAVEPIEPVPPAVSSNGREPAVAWM